MGHGALQPLRPTRTPASPLDPPRQSVGVPAAELLASVHPNYLLTNDDRKRMLARTRVTTCACERQAPLWRAPRPSPETSACDTARPKCSRGLIHVRR